MRLKRPNIFKRIWYDCCLSPPVCWKHMLFKVLASATTFECKACNMEKKAKPDRYEQMRTKAAGWGVSKPYGG